MDAVVSKYLKSVDRLPHHFQMHFIHAAEIVGYKHPGRNILSDCAEPTEYSRPVPLIETSGIADWWRDRVYFRLVHDMHLHPETEDEMDRRLGDSRDQWLERADPATVK